MTGVEGSTESLVWVGEMICPEIKREFNVFLFSNTLANLDKSVADPETWERRAKKHEI